MTSIIKITPLEQVGIITVAVDPGKNDAGVAIYRNSELHAATLVASTGGPVAVAKLAAIWVEARLRDLNPNAKCHYLAVEGQQIYKGVKNDPNDMIQVAHCAGAAMAFIDAIDKQIILPRVWTGKVPKEVRVRRWLQNASQRELDIVRSIKCPKTKLHNCVDAICIGAYSLGRSGTAELDNENFTEQ